MTDNIRLTKSKMKHLFNLVFQIEYHTDFDQLSLYNNYIIANDLSFSEKEYILESFKGVCNNLDDIDEIIKKYLKGFTIDRLEKEVLAIFRIVIYGIKYTDVPLAVNINEGVEFSKDYVTDKGVKYINGVLRNIGKELSNE